MEDFKQAIASAKRNFQIADHMLTVTYPLIKDTKLLLAIMENIFLSMTNAMNSVLYFEKLYKTMPAFQESFESRFSAFKQHCVPRHGIDKSYILDIQDIREILIEHKKSAMEFVRRDRFVICAENYKIRTLSIADIKSYLSKAKLFIEEIEHITDKNA
jgi:hypothetical protein